MAHSVAAETVASVDSPHKAPSLLVLVVFSSWTWPTLEMVRKHPLRVCVPREGAECASVVVVACRLHCPKPDRVLHPSGPRTQKKNHYALNVGLLTTDYYVLTTDYGLRSLDSPLLDSKGVKAS